jgi:fatty acid amide hydrolase
MSEPTEFFPRDAADSESSSPSPGCCSRGAASRLAARAARARAVRAEQFWRLGDAGGALPAELRHLPDAELLRKSCAELLQLLAAGPRTLTAVQLLAAFVRRVRAVWALNAVVCLDLPRALAAARASDARRARGGLPRALEGLPVSVKDHIEQEGADCGGGLACRTGAPAARTSLLVSALEAAGAVPFCRTQVPQLLMLPETDNLVFGRALNPWAAARSPGGSSGGEAALLSARGSVLGIGTDIGGSLRIPAHCCGIVAFKPTAGRLTSHGVQPPFAGQTSVASTAGPMARCVADAEAMLAAWLAPQHGMRDGDPCLACPGAGWDAAAAAPSPRRLRVGVMVDDGGFFPAAAPCVRAVREAAAAAAAAGHEVVDFCARDAGVDLVEAILLYYALMGADGGMASFVAALRGEPLLPTYAKLRAIAALPGAVRPAVAWLLRAVAGRPREAALVAAARKYSVAELWALNARAGALRAAYLAAWRAARLDVLLAPGLGLPALPHGAAAELTPACSYTFLFNLFNLPAGCLPVTRVRAGEDVYEPLPHHRDRIGAAAAAAAAGSAGLPVGVQVVALPHADELAVRVMRELEAALRARGGAAECRDAGGVPDDVLAATLANAPPVPR